MIWSVNERERPPLDFLRASLRESFKDGRVLANLQPVYVAAETGVIRPDE